MSSSTSVAIVSSSARIPSGRGGRSRPSPAPRGGRRPGIRLLDGPAALTGPAPSCAPSRSCPALQRGRSHLPGCGRTIHAYRLIDRSRLHSRACAGRSPTLSVASLIMKHDDTRLEWAEFQRLIGHFDEDPSIENYVALRRSFPGGDTTIHQLAEVDPRQKDRRVHEGKLSLHAVVRDRSGCLCRYHRVGDDSLGLASPLIAAAMAEPVRPPARRADPPGAARRLTLQRDFNSLFDGTRDLGSRLFGVFPRRERQRDERSPVLAADAEASLPTKSQWRDARSPSARDDR